ncbi:NACHT domain-containing protein [Streptomyces sp. NPDC002817]|uniref:NACHT domain-containing protein n=1 Tax=Streptomyces sp. NPDC088357 TaxID=3154655 RepID=UPI00342D84A1
MSGVEVMAGRVAVQAIKPVFDRLYGYLAQRGIAKGDLYLSYKRSMEKAQQKPAKLLGTLEDLPEGIALSVVKDFLETPTVRAITQQLVAVEVLQDDQAHRKLNFALRSEFRSSFPDPEIKLPVKNQYAEILFTVLDSHAREAAGVLVSKSKAPEQVLQWAQHTLMKATLESIEKYVSLLNAPGRIDIETRRQLIETYTAAFNGFHEKVVLPDLKSRTTVHYADLYVEPSLEQAQRNDASTFSTSQMLGRIDRTVILGDPGAGKSTTTGILALRLLKERKRVPFYIVMKELDISRTGFSVIAAVEKMLDERYNTPLPRRLLEELLLDGSAVLFFDGLDELLNPRNRRLAAEVIESVSNLYPLATIVVTSRRVGYDAARLQGAMFQVYKLHPFTEPQVRQYVRNWFSLSGELDPHRVLTAVEHFMGQSSTIPDLRSNPLMLAFMCVLYRGLGYKYIPHSRPELYSKCADLLLGEWDMHRGVIDDLVDLGAVKIVLSELAYPVLTDQAYRSGFTIEDVHELLDRYLVQDRGMDLPQARATVDEMLEVCRGRAWIFTDVGTDGRGREYFNFTHQSFREYFSAWFLNRNHETPEALADILFPYICAGQWEILAQISMSICDLNTRNGGSRVVRRMLSRLTQLPRATQSNALDVLVRCVDVVELQQDVLESLVHRIVMEAVSASTPQTPQTLVQILAPSFRHEAKVPRSLEATLRSSLQESSGNAFLELLWIATHLEDLAPSDCVPSTRARLEEAADNLAGGWEQPLRSLEPAALAHELGLRRGLHGGNAAVTSRLLRPLYTRHFTNVSAESRLGPSFSALWLIRSMAANRRKGQPGPGRAARILGELGDARTFGAPLQNLDRPWLWDSLEREAQFLVLTNDTVERALRSSTGHRQEVRSGLALLVLGILDAFDVFRESSQYDQQSTDHLTKRLRQVHELLLTYSGGLARRDRDLIANVGSGMYGGDHIWKARPVDEYDLGGS